MQSLQRGEPAQRAASLLVRIFIWFQSETAIMMNQNRLFKQTRHQLALWFITVMGIILIICEFSLYQMVAHAHRVTVDRELTSVANTIHNGLSTLLTQPGKLEPEVNRLLPDICINGEVLRDRCLEVNNTSLKK